MAHRENLIHHENIQIRGVIGNDDEWFLRDFRLVFLHKDQKQNTQQIAPKQKNCRAPLARFWTQDQDCCNRIKHK